MHELYDRKKSFVYTSSNRLGKTPIEEYIHVTCSTGGMVDENGMRWPTRSSLTVESPHTSYVFELGGDIQRRRPDGSQYSNTVSLADTLDANAIAKGLPR